MSNFSDFWYTCFRFTVTVGYMQIDNQLPLTSMPILLAPDLHNDTDDFVIKAVSSMKSGTAEAIQVYPYMGLKVFCKIQCHNVHYLWFICTSILKYVLFQDLFQDVIYIWSNLICAFEW